MKTTVKSNTNTTIYILLGIIALLLVGNAFLFLTQEKTGTHLVTIREEKAILRQELNELQDDLDMVSEKNINLSEELKATKLQLDKKVIALQQALDNNQLTAKELSITKSEVNRLRYNINKYVEDIDMLKADKKELIAANKSLKSSVSKERERVESLNTINSQLKDQIKAASVLKLANVNVLTLEVEQDGGILESSQSVKARKVNTIRVEFKIAENKVANEGKREVYLQIFDPEGKVIVPSTDTAARYFLVNGEKLQYTNKTAIFYSKTNPVYAIEWMTDTAFDKGDYKIMLYIDGEKANESGFHLD